MVAYKPPVTQYKEKVEIIVYQLEKPEVMTTDFSVYT